MPWNRDMINHAGVLPVFQWENFFQQLYKYINFQH